MDRPLAPDRFEDLFAIGGAARGGPASRAARALQAIHLLAGATAMADGTRPWT